MASGKMVKVYGNQPESSRKRPTRLDCGRPSNAPPNTTLEKRVEDVFIPAYDRRGYLTDNAAQANLGGKAFNIPSGSGSIQEVSE